MDSSVYIKSDIFLYNLIKTNTLFIKVSVTSRQEFIVEDTCLLSGGVCVLQMFAGPRVTSVGPVARARGVEVTGRIRGGLAARPYRTGAATQATRASHVARQQLY